jgi:hypothetical protein
MLFDFAPIPASNPLDPSILALLGETCGPNGKPRKPKRMTPVALPNPGDVPDVELARRIGRLALHRAGLI